jgi:hypothetical protein
MPVSYHPMAVSYQRRDLTITSLFALMIPSARHGALFVQPFGGFRIIDLPSWRILALTAITVMVVAKVIA